MVLDFSADHLLISLDCQTNHKFICYNILYFKEGEKIWQMKKNFLKK